MIEIEEHQRVVLTMDLPDQKLNSGDVGTVVHVYNASKLFEVEFCTLTGDTIAVVSVDKAQIRSVDGRDVAHARRVDASLGRPP